MWSKFVYLVYSLRYCCLFTFNVKNRIAQKWSKWHFFNSIFHWEVTGSVFGPFKTQNTILTKMPNFCRTSSLTKNGNFILLDLSKSMIFHKIQITFLWFYDPRHFVLIKLISPCWTNNALKIPTRLLPCKNESCRWTISLCTNFIPIGLKKSTTVFFLCPKQIFQNLHLIFSTYYYSLIRYKGLKFHSVNKN